MTVQKGIGMKKKIKDFIDYISVLPSSINDKIRDFRLNHINLGKLVRRKDGLFSIKNISWDICWQTDRVLAIIIRDYLRQYIEESPAIGNCVISDNPEGLKYIEAVQSDEKEKIFAARWQDLVNSVADEFDKLSCLIENYSHNNPDADKEIEELTAKAFKDLTYIFNDLCW